MKKFLLLIAVLISLKCVAQTGSNITTVNFSAGISTASNNIVLTNASVVSASTPPSLNHIKSFKTKASSIDSVSIAFNCYANQARIGLLLEGGGVVLGMGGALLSANSVSATPINVSLITGGVIAIVGFLVHYDSYKYLKHLHIKNRN